MSADALFRRWLWANFVGWLLGFVFLMIGAMSMAVLLGLENVQYYLGIGMGAGIGWAQTRAAVPLLGAPARWGWACVVGMGVPFVLSDVVRGVWGGLEYIPALYLNVAVGGLLVGLLQRPMLRAYGGRSGWWVPACVVGWVLAAATVPFFGFSGGWRALIAVAAILAGGVILGAVTGGALVWMRLAADRPEGRSGA